MTVMTRRKSRARKRSYNCSGSKVKTRYRQTFLVCNCCVIKYKADVIVGAIIDGRPSNSRHFMLIWKQNGAPEAEDFHRFKANMAFTQPLRS